MLSNTIAKHEFSSTFLSKHPVYSGSSDWTEDWGNNENIPDEWKHAWEDKKTEEIKEVDEAADIKSWGADRLRIKKE